MAAYRLYCLDGAGKIIAAEWIEAETDQAALEAARSLKDAIACEIWDQDRLVGRVSAARSAGEAGRSTRADPAHSPYAS